MGLGVRGPAQVLIPPARNYMTSVKLFNLSAVLFFHLPMGLIISSSRDYDKNLITGNRIT